MRISNKNNYMFPHNCNFIVHSAYPSLYCVGGSIGLQVLEGQSDDPHLLPIVAEGNRWAQLK